VLYADTVSVVSDGDICGSMTLFNDEMAMGGQWAMDKLSAVERIVVIYVWTRDCVCRVKGGKAMFRQRMLRKGQ
jgi:hypothetical protein